MIKLKHKLTNQIISCDYQDCWISNIVNKGITHEYEILKYPDIVQLMFVQPLGNTVKNKIMDRTKAIEIKNKYPQNYFFEEIDIKNQILDDIKTSNQIKNYKSLFSRLSRIARKIRMIRYPKITLTKKPIVDLSIIIIGTIAAYGIMKYMFKWF